MPNDIKIKGSKPISENLSTVTVGDQTSCLEISDKNGARVTGDLEVTGDIKGNITDITFDDITFDDITCDDITCDDILCNKIVTDSITIDGTEIDSSGDLTLDVQGDISLDHGSNDEVKLLEDGSDFGAIYGDDSGSYIKLYEGVGVTTDSFSIYTTTHGATSIGTVDVAGQSANMTFDADGTLQLKAYGSGLAIAESLSKDILISPGGKVHIDKNRSHTTASSTIKGLHVDVDRTGTVTTGVDIVTGIDLDVNHTGASGGTISSIGLDIDIVGDTGGHSTIYGTMIDTSGADVTYGLWIESEAGTTSNGIYIDNEDGGVDFKNVSSAQVTDFFTINTIADGETTLKTVESGGGSTAHLNMVADGDFTVDAEGNISLDAQGGNITLLDGGSTYTPSATSDATTKTYVDTGDETSKYYYSFISANFYNTGVTASVMLPLNGYIMEQASPGTNGTEFYGLIAPHDGILVNVKYRSEQQLRDPIIFELMTSGDGTELPTTVTGTLTRTWSGGSRLLANTYDTADFTGSLDSGANTVTKGNIIAIRMTMDGSAVVDCLIMTTWRYDVTT